MTSRQIHGRPFLSLFFCAVFLPGVALADHGAGQATKADQGKHQRHGAAISLPGGANPPSVAITVSKDPVGGWNLHVRTGNFRFAPDHASLPHIPGEGHAHLYVNGRKTARLYGPWYHIGELPAGKVEIVVTLNANDHRAFSIGGQRLRAVARVDNTGHTH